MFKPGSDSLIYTSDTVEIYDSEELNFPVLHLKEGVVKDASNALEMCDMFIFKAIDLQHYQLRRRGE